MTARPKVSFVVPTLNRGRYVVRAVDSCLAAATAAVDVEVVVLDSMSDDGSWDL
ncbi:glycosyltransferase [Sphingomonas aerolata]